MSVAHDSRYLGGPPFVVFRRVLGRSLSNKRVGHFRRGSDTSNAQTILGAASLAVLAKGADFLSGLVDLTLRNVRRSRRI
jgi:hypothetical protein